MGSSASKPIASPVVDEKRAVSQVTTSLSALSIASPTSLDGSLTLPEISSWEEEVSADSKAQLARTVLVHSDIRDALVSRTSTTHIFNYELDYKPSPITNQKSSGRCWLFATTNVLRYDVMKKLKLKEFQLSQVNVYVFIKLIRLTVMSSLISFSGTS